MQIEDLYTVRTLSEICVQRNSPQNSGQVKSGLTMFSSVHRFQQPQSTVKMTGTLVEPRVVTEVGRADRVVVGVPRTVEELRLREAGLVTASFAKSATQRPVER